MSSWYESDIITQRGLLAVMLSCQTPKYLTGCGLIKINIDTFASVSTLLQFIDSLITFPVTGV